MYCSLKDWSVAIGPHNRPSLRQTCEFCRYFGRRARVFLSPFWYYLAQLWSWFFYTFSKYWVCSNSYYRYVLIFIGNEEQKSLNGISLANSRTRNNSRQGQELRWSFYHFICCSCRLSIVCLKGTFLFNLGVWADYSILLTLKNHNPSSRSQRPILLRVLENAARPRARTYTAEFTYVQNFQNAFKNTEPYSKHSQNYHDQSCERRFVDIRKTRKQ